MPRELTARRTSESVKEGFDRLQRFRKARASHIKEYIGTYMSETHGLTGDKPLNLVFLAIRALVPNLVQREGLNKVITKLLTQREYAEKLGLALNDVQKAMKLSRILRAGIVDMCFGMAAFKTSLAQSGQMLQIASDINIDPGQIYTELVSMDDLTVDPVCRSFDKAAFIGHRIRIERNRLLEVEGFRRDLVRRLPRSGMKADSDRRAEELTQEDPMSLETMALQDYVNIVELYVPEAEAICYLPDPAETIFEDFLKVEDYYGPPTGPYTFGMLTQPVPDNPFPIAPVGVWRDLADMANRLFKKAMDQADRQKNVGIYSPANADVAEAIHDAMDGEWVASEDPQGVNIQSFEGTDQGTVAMTQSLYGWFNMMAGNPDLMAGTGINADKATGQQILQQNASITIGDMQAMVYDMTADISYKQAWYLHNDDLLFVPGQPGIPLIKRLPSGGEQQLYLTPADKTGPFELLGFEIVRRSMSVVDPATRVRLVSQFCTQIIPQAFNSLMIATQAGQPFNISRYLSIIAEDMGISEIMDEIWEDPTFRERMTWYQQTVGSPKKAGGVGSTQNGGLPVGGTPLPGQTEQFNMDAQATAAEGQQAGAIGGF